MPGLSVSPPPVAEHLAAHHNAPILIGDLENVRGEPPATLPELHRDPDRPLATPRDQLRKAAASRHGSRDIVGQGVL